MKYSFFIFLSFFLFEISQAQIFTGPNSYKALFFSAGYRTVETTPSDILLRYYDESPVTDGFISRTFVEDKKAAFGLGGSFEFGNFNSLHIEVAYDASIGNAFHSSFEVGGGYNFPIQHDKLYARPVLSISYGPSRFNLGNLENRSVYVEVNGTRFFDQYILVQVSTAQLGLKPRAEIVYLLGDTFAAKLQVGYMLILTDTKARIDFEGKGENGQAAYAREFLTARNVDFRVNGISNNELPLNLNGIFANLSIGIMF